MCRENSATARSHSGLGVWLIRGGKTPVTPEACRHFLPEGTSGQRLRTWPLEGNSPCSEAGIQFKTQTGRSIPLLIKCVQSLLGCTNNCLGGRLQREAIKMRTPFPPSMAKVIALPVWLFSCQIPAVRGSACPALCIPVSRGSFH